MMADKGGMGKNVNKFLKQAQESNLDAMQALGDYFGLNPKDTTKRVNKNATMWDKAKSVAQSSITGLAKPFAGLWQAGYYAQDKANEFLNKNLGTNNYTNRYQDYTSSFNSALESAKESRRQAGFEGVDLSMLGGELVGTAPTMLVGGGSIGAGVKGATKYVATQAAVGAGAGATTYAKDANERKSNMLYGAAGAVAGDMAGRAISKGVGRVGQSVARAKANKTGATAQAAEKLIDNGIRANGLQVSAGVRNAMVRDATNALKKGKKVDVNEAYRKNLVQNHGIQPTQAQISRKADIWTKERELAKKSTELNDVHVQNSDELDRLMREMIADTGEAGGGNMAKMGRAFSTLKGYDDAVRANIGKLYDDASQMGGNQVRLNHLRFINNATDALEDNMLGSFVKGDVMNSLKGMFVRPDFEFNYQKAEELIKQINKRMGATTDGNERYALGIIRDKLEQEITDTADDLARTLPRQGGDTLTDTNQKYNQARQAYKNRATTMENTPAYKDAVNGVEAHDGSLQKYVINAKAPELARMVDTLKQAPNGQQNIADLQGAVLEHILGKSVNNAGAFNARQFAKAIDDFGDNRLKVLFTTEQRARLNDIRKVADILMQEPRQAHLNRSNTSHQLVRQILGIANIAGKMPVVGNMALGSLDAISNLSKAGAAHKMINGQVSTQKTTLGLTDEQLRRLGLLDDGVRAGGRALGIGMATE